MKTTVFNINYNNFNKLDKEVSLFILNNLLRHQFAIENINVNIFHKYNDSINDSIKKLTEFYENKRDMTKKDIKKILSIHKELEEETKDFEIIEDNFTNWLKNKKNHRF